MSSATELRPVPAGAPEALGVPERLRGALAGLRPGERAARYCLAGLVLLGLAVAVGAAGQRSALVPPSRNGFPGWMVGPFKGIASFLPDDRLALGLGFSGLVLLMFACYLVVVRHATALDRRHAIGAVVALHVIFLLGPPMPLTDVFNYLDYARLGTLHGLNPYVDVPATVHGDAAYRFATWHHLLSPYGPLFTLASYALVPLGLIAGYWTLKLLTGAAALGCLALVWRIAERRGRDPLKATLFVGLNPIWLVYGVGGVHNDVFMLALILIGAAAVLDRRDLSAGAALAGAAAVKVSALLLLPFAIAGAGDRRRVLAGVAGAGALLVAAGVLVFGLNGPGLETQSVLVTPLSAPNLLGLALGQGGLTDPVRILVEAALAVTVVWLLVRVVRGSDWLDNAGWAVLALVVSLSWAMPWYAAWVLPLAAVALTDRLRRATLVLSAFFLLSLLPMTGWLLADVCNCYPGDTHTGKRNAHEIKRYLK